MRTATLFHTLEIQKNAISILAVLADRDAALMPDNVPVLAISILAVLADRDTEPLIHNESVSSISILAVLADRDRGVPVAPAADDLFQSSRSLRTATFLPGMISRPCGFQSSRSLRTATSSGCCHRREAHHFNPRGPCGPRRWFGIRFIVS